MAGLQIADGKTFRWIGAYQADLNQRKTVSVELNLFAQFRPSISPEYRRTPFVLLGNMSPELQIHVGRTLLKLGPKYVTIKKGEHGCLLMSAN